MSLFDARTRNGAVDMADGGEGVSRRVFLRLGALATAGGALAGCTFRPLYATTSADGTPLATELAAIAIDAPGDQITQVIRNRLILAFTGGGPPAPTRYQLGLRATASTAAIAIEQFDGTPTSRVVTVTASFRLIDGASGELLFSGTSTAAGSYDFTDQRFANLRAERDAERRAAEQVAIDIRTRIASHLARRA